MANLNFDAKRPSNWYGGIARAMLDHKLDWAPISALVSRTLKAMGILTRGAPRELMVKQIQRAIRDLIRTGVLTEYHGGQRVRILDKDRIRRYATRHPQHLPLCSEESSEAIVIDDEVPEQRGLFGNIGQDSSLHGTSAEAGFTLPPLTFLAKRPEGGGDNTSSMADRIHHTDEEEAALNLLFDDKRSINGESGYEQPSAPKGNPASNTDLATVLSCLAQGRPTDVVCDGCELSANFGDFRLRLEVRRNGSVRGVMGFPEEMLGVVLKGVRRRWHRAVIGTTDAGVPGIIYIWEVNVPPEVLAQQLLEDVVFLEDSLSA